MPETRFGEQSPGASILITSTVQMLSLPDAKEPSRMPMSSGSWFHVTSYDNNLQGSRERFCRHWSLLTVCRWFHPQPHCSAFCSGLLPWLLSKPCVLMLARSCASSPAHLLHVSGEQTPCPCVAMFPAFFPVSYVHSMNGLLSLPSQICPFRASSPGPCL